MPQEDIDQVLARIDQLESKLLLELKSSFQLIIATLASNQQKEQRGFLSLTAEVLYLKNRFLEEQLTSKDSFKKILQILKKSNK